MSASGSGAGSQGRDLVSLWWWVTKIEPGDLDLCLDGECCLGHLCHDSLGGSRWIISLIPKWIPNHWLLSELFTMRHYGLSFRPGFSQAVLALPWIIISFVILETLKYSQGNQSEWVLLSLVCAPWCLDYCMEKCHFLVPQGELMFVESLDTSVKNTMETHQWNWTFLDQGFNRV